MDVLGLNACFCGVECAPVLVCVCARAHVCVCVNVCSVGKNAARGTREARVPLAMRAQLPVQYGGKV